MVPPAAADPPFMDEYVAAAPRKVQFAVACYG
jgi:hypothetical protein